MNSQQVSPREPTNPPSDLNWIDQVNIRTATEEDLPGMEWEGEFTRFRRLYKTAYERSLSGLTVLWVADLPGQGLIGQVFIQLNCDRPELADGRQRAYLYGFRVRSDFRNCGLGTRLMQIVEQDLIQRGFSRLTLNVAKENQAAMRLYNRFGFLIVAFEPGYWSFEDHNGDWQSMHEPAWRMEKALISK